MKSLLEWWEKHKFKDMEKNFLVAANNLKLEFYGLLVTNNTSYWPNRLCLFIFPLTQYSRTKVAV